MSDKKAISIFGTIPEGTIFNPTPPYNLRNDCQIGQWKRGEDKLMGSSLDISILKACKFYGNIGETYKTHWLQLWFVASPDETKIPRNTVCCTYLKSRSLESFSGELIELMTSQIDPGTVIFKAGFEKHSGKLGNYYSVSWEVREREGEAEKKQLEQIVEFIGTNPTFTDTTKPKALICVDGMSQDEIEGLDAVIDAIEAGEAPNTNGAKQLTSA